MPKLELQRKTETYTKDGQLREVKKYFVKVNGINAYMLTADNTSREILENYFENEGKGETK